MQAHYRKVNVLIASPGDASAGVRQVERALAQWNLARGDAELVMLQPLQWKAASVPTSGEGDTQSVLNSQLVDKSNVVIAIFYFRLGSKTPRALSGTAEEVERSISAGKKVHLFFARKKRPYDVDEDQFKALRDFKAKFARGGLVAEFKSGSELFELVLRTIESDIEFLREDIRSPDVPLANEPPRVIGQLPVPVEAAEPSNMNENTDYTPHPVRGATAERTTRGRFTPDISFAYQYLRYIIVAALLSILISVFLQSFVVNCWLGSVSAYYYTPVRSLLVGSLVAIGLALLALKGQSPEGTVVASFSGCMAILVAMVPTVPDDSCFDTGFVLSKEGVAAAVQNNIWSLLIVVVLVTLALVIIRRRIKLNFDLAAMISGPFADSVSRARSTVIAIVCVIVVMVELAYFLVLPDVFIERSHAIALVTMGAGMIAVMLFNAFEVYNRHGGGSGRFYRRVYLNLALTLGLTLLIAVTAVWTSVAVEHVVLIAELVILVDLLVYWMVQIVDFGKEGD